MDNETPEEQAPETEAEVEVTAEATPESEVVAEEEAVAAPEVEVVAEAPAEEEAVAAPEVEAAEPGEAGLPELTLGEEAAEETTHDPDYKPVIRGKIDKNGVAMGTGRRKTSVARVRIKDGKGDFVVNGKPLAVYFNIERDQLLVKALLDTTETSGKVDIWVRVRGGGTTGQTRAILLGIARALEAKDNSLHETLKAGGYLTRDSRMVERKKYGLKKARKSFQFSKR